eukprot:SAG31_NODE_604_length_13629_cov_11.035994_13_plen_104_part_00
MGSWRPWRHRAGDSTTIRWTSKSYGMVSAPLSNTIVCMPFVHRANMCARPRATKLILTACVGRSSARAEAMQSELIGMSVVAERANPNYANVAEQANYEYSMR